MILSRFAFEERHDGAARRSAPLDDLQQLTERHQLLEPLFERFAGDLASVSEHERARLGRALEQE